MSGTRNAEESLEGRLAAFRRAALSARVRGTDGLRAPDLAAAIGDSRLARLTDPGRTLALAGRPGAGKTTLLDLLTEAPPTKAAPTPTRQPREVRARLDSRSITAMAERGWVGWPEAIKDAATAASDGMNDGVAAPGMCRSRLGWTLPKDLALLDLPGAEAPLSSLPPSPQPSPDAVALIFRVDWNATKDSLRDPLHDEVGLLAPLRAALETFGTADTLAVANFGSPKSPDAALRHWQELGATGEAVRREVGALAASWGFPGLVVVPVAARAALGSPGDGDRFGVVSLRAAVRAWLKRAAAGPTAARFRDAADAVADVARAVEGALGAYPYGAPGDSAFGGGGEHFASPTPDALAALLAKAAVLRRDLLLMGTVPR